MTKCPSAAQWHVHTTTSGWYVSRGFVARYDLTRWLYCEQADYDWHSQMSSELQRVTLMSLNIVCCYVRVYDFFLVTYCCVLRQNRKHKNELKTFNMLNVCIDCPVVSLRLYRPHEPTDVSVAARKFSWFFKASNWLSVPEDKNRYQSLHACQRFDICAIRNIVHVHYMYTCSLSSRLRYQILMLSLMIVFRYMNCKVDVKMT